MRRRLLKASIVSTAVTAAMSLGACGSDPSDKALHSAADQIVKSYTELIRTATTRPVRPDELRAAGIDPDADGVRQYLAGIREASTVARWLPDSFDIRWHVSKVKRTDQSSAEVKANIGYEARMPGSGLNSQTGSLDPHVMQLELRDGQWILIRDFINESQNSWG